MEAQRAAAARRAASGGEFPQELVRASTAVSDATVEEPIWERLARLSIDRRAGLRTESMAALHLYRQEVLHGQDVSARGEGRGGRGKGQVLVLLQRCG